MTTAYRWLRYEAVPQIRHVWTNLFRYKPFRFVEMDYEEYWREGHSSGRLQDPRVRAFGRIVERGASVGEIGCGDGTLLEYLRDHNGARVKGYDVSEHAIARTRARDIDAEVWDARAGALDGTFDYIIIADCLEHLPGPEGLLNGLRGRFARALVISIPNSCYWRYRFRVLFGKFMVQWVAHPGEHLRFWSIADMRWWLTQLGFSMRRAYPTWGVPVLKHVWPAMFAQNVIYVITETTPAATEPGIGPQHA